AASTTATFSTAGTYVLTLTARTNGLSSSSSVTITVNAASSPASAKMAWDPNTDSNLAGYNVYRSTQSGAYTSAPLNGSTLVTVTSFTDSTVQSGQTYYYVIRAVSTSGLESGNSNEIQFPAPVNQPPTVSAGANQTISLPASATLSGSVTGVPA